MELVVVAVEVIRSQLVDRDEDDESAAIVRQRRLRAEWSGDEDVDGGEQESERAHGEEGRRYL